jgi:hypothetical protein
MRVLPLDFGPHISRSPRRGRRLANDPELRKRIPAYGSYILHHIVGGQVFDNPADFYMAGAADHEDVIPFIAELHGSRMCPTDEWAGGIDQFFPSRRKPISLPLADPVSRNQYCRRLRQAIPVILFRGPEATNGKLLKHHFVMNELSVNRHACWGRQPSDNAESVTDSETHPGNFGNNHFHQQPSWR